VISSLSQSSDPTALYNARVKGRQMLLDNPAKESKLKKEIELKKELRKKEKAQRKLGIIGRRKRELWSLDKSSIK
jgi:ribonuclease P protein subunit POP4